MARLHSRVLSVLLAPLLLAVFAPSFIACNANGQTSSDHMTSDQSHMPTANIGNRQVALEFSTNPTSPLPSETVDVNLYLFDKGTNTAINHATFNFAIYNEEGKRVFLEVVHGHDGKVSIRFVNDPSAQKYKLSANYDTLSASYVSDFGNPIKVQGQVFSTPGTYKVVAEVTGIDYENTFLPEPVKYEFTLPLMPMQTIPVKYQNITFQVGLYSPIKINSAELFTDKKQLVLHSMSPNATAPDEFAIRLEIPKQMMSGPFTASYGDANAEPQVQEVDVNEQSTTLLVTGKQSEMTQPGSTDSSIIVAATNVVPEFAAGLVGSMAALAFLAVIAYVTAFKKQFHA